jgi:alcohol dehydrogenase (cytochrome c)
MLSRPVLPLTAVCLLAGAPAGAQVLFADNAAISGNPAAGFATYTQVCMSCHGQRLEGSPFGPTLIGPAFMNKWRGKPASTLLAQIRDTMPPKGTGTSVQPEALPDILAMLVRANLQGLPPVAVAPAAPRSAAVPRVAVPRPLPANLAQRLASLGPVSAAMLAAPPDGDWLMWRRTFDAAGFSPLRQIDRGNVQTLRQAWRLPLDPGANEITPLVHDGVLFVFSGNVVLAVDGAGGTPLWRYEHGGADRYSGQAGRMKSMAIHGQALLVATPDGRVLALEARSGKVLWNTAIAGITAGSGLNLTSGPLVARGVVMVGASLGLNNRGGCFIVGLDATTGKERWRFNTIARPGTPEGDSWNDAPLNERFGGGVWATGSYDPQLNLAYFGIGNTYNTAALLQPRPGATGVTRNDALFTDTTVALRPESGELVWHYQHHRRDVWDQDWAFEQTLVTLGSGASSRRAVVTGGKAGIFEAVDAATGKFLFAHDSGLTNLIVGIDPHTGEKRTSPALEPVAGKTMLLCPGNFGARNWPATALNPATGTLFMPLLESCADFMWTPPGAAQTANGGTDLRFAQQRPRPGSDGNLGRMVALDLATQRVQWTHRQRTPLSSSLLATAGGLVFAGDLGRSFGAFDQTDGKRLWTTQLPAAAESTPVTYSVGERQYIAVVSGEGSRLWQNVRQLDSSLGAPQPDITLVVFALPAD